MYRPDDFAQIAIFVICSLSGAYRLVRVNWSDVNALEKFKITNGVLGLAVGFSFGFTYWMNLARNGQAMAGIACGGALGALGLCAVVLRQVSLFGRRYHPNEFESKVTIRGWGAVVVGGLFLLGARFFFGLAMQAIDAGPAPAPSVPAGPVVVGQEADSRPIYLCLVTTGATHAGKTWNDNAICDYADGTKEVTTDKFEVPAQAAPITWVPRQTADAAQLVVVGGSASGNRHYLCRAPHEGGVHPGEMDSTASGCRITYGGDAYTINDAVEVATANGAQPLTSPALQRIAGNSTARPSAHQ